MSTGEIIGWLDERENKLTTFLRYRRLARDAFLPDDSDGVDCAAFTLFLVFVAAAPFLYGLNPPARWAVGGGVVMPTGTLLLELFAFIVTATWLLAKTRARRLNSPVIPLGAVIALAILGLVQLLPLPENVLEQAAPTNLEIYHGSAEILGLFNRKVSLRPKISIAPGETFGAVLLVLAYAAVFLSSASLLRNRLRRRLFGATLLGTAGIQILLAVIWESPEKRMHGIFVNPDHLAGYLEIALAIAFGSLWADVLTSADRGREAQDRAERFEKRLVPLAGHTVVWAVIAVGIGLTQSRGGILSAAIVTLVLVGMAMFHRRAHSHRRAATGVAFAILAGVLLVATTAGASPFLRFLELDPRHLGGNVRVTLWRTSLHAWREFPLLGSGLGTFREAFRRVQPRQVSGLVEHAHSDLLQLLVTGGAIGGALGVLAFGSLFVALVRAWRRQKHREESALVLAGFGALLSLTLHGLVDFNLSIPAITAILACVLGAAWAAGVQK